MLSKECRPLFVATCVSALVALGGRDELHTGCGTAVGFVPGNVQLIYPESNSANVGPNTTVLVYNASAGVPITLSAGSAAPIALSAATLPSPLPSPAATTINSGSFNFAALLPPLTARTTYIATAKVREVGCGIDQPATLGVGSFTVQ
jgi:hypothetical protein